MNTEFFQLHIRGRIEELKTLYAQLFILMEQGLDSSADSEDAHLPLGELMRAAASKNESFHNTLAEAGDWRAACSPDFIAEVDDFQTKLQSGLEALYARVREKMQEVERERDRVRALLAEAQDKKLGRRAYAPARKNAPSMLFNSEV